MHEDIVSEAEAILREERERRRQRQRDLWACVVVRGTLLLLLGGGAWYYVWPHVRAAYQEGQAERARATAEREAGQKAFNAFYEKPLWDRRPQVSEEEVTAYATSYLQRLGYTLAGNVVCSTWGFDGWHKQYRCQALVDPAWPPLSLTCGPRQTEEVWPLGCVLHQ
jgi:hypothetical protein